ncbi:MAG: metallophosphoesterase family protein [Paludibacteraceae bacterium]|nr:metallophosphoesterase family protein [Paludibacteraceae bacterium]
MRKIGILSDTHAYLNPKVLKYFEECDEIWHAGDWGSVEVADALCAFKPVRGVCGNIDDRAIRSQFPLYERFMCEGVDVYMTHVGGYPGKYEPRVFAKLCANPPRLFVCGHSHILKVMFDKSLNMLCVNPGAAGQYGQQLVPTLIRLEIDGEKIQNLEVIEMR